MNFSKKIRYKSGYLNLLLKLQNNFIKKGRPWYDAWAKARARATTQVNQKKRGHAQAMKSLP